MAKPKTPKTAASALQPEPKGAAPVKFNPAANQLPVPLVRNATANNTLPPLSSTAGTDIIISAAIATGVKITVYWAIKGQEADPVFTAFAQGTGSAGVEVPVPAWVVGFCIGQTLSIWYETPTDSSLHLELTVEVIEPEHMPVPEFQNLTFFQGSWWLDMTQFPGNAGIELCTWRFITAGQRLWVEAVGNEHLSPRRFSWVLEGHVVTEQEAQKGFCFLLEIWREWLAENEDWSSVTVHAGVTFNGAEGSPPEDPSISHIPANAHEMQRATANLRVGEPALKLHAPTIREAVFIEGQGYVINPANALKGLHIIVAYDGIQPGDEVCLTFSGTSGAGSPTLPCIEVQAGQTSVEFHVLPSVVSVNFGHPITVSYKVLRGSSWPSPSLTAQVLNPTGLKGVTVEEAPEGKLCLNNFPGDANATVGLWDFIAPGQTCWLWIVGEYENGLPFYLDVLIAEPLKPEWVTSGVWALLNRQALEQLADCTVFEIYFSVNFRGLPDKSSALAFQTTPLKMEQADWALKAPTVTEADGEKLTVWNGRDGVTVRVAYERMSPQHEITVCWKENGVCLSLPSKPGNFDPGYVEFKVAREAVIRGIGKTVPVSFSVSSQCKQATSPALELAISKPTRLPTPDVKEATLGVLKLDSFVGDAHVKIFDERFAKAYWFALEGQKAWIRAVGTLKNGTEHTINVRIAQSVTEDEVNNGLMGVLSRTELERLKPASNLSIHGSVTTDGSLSELSAVQFPTLPLFIEIPPNIIYEDFTGQPLRRISAGESFGISTMTITHVSGPSLCGINRDLSDNLPWAAGPSIAIHDGRNTLLNVQIVELRLNFDCSSLKFGVTALDYEMDITYYDKLGKSLGRSNVKGGSIGGTYNQWVEFFAPPGEKVSRIMISARDTCFMDNFEFRL